MTTSSPTSSVPTTTTRPTTTQAPTTSQPTTTVAPQPLNVIYVTGTSRTAIAIGSGFATNPVQFRFTNSTKTVTLPGVSSQDSTAQVSTDFDLVGNYLQLSADNFATAVTAFNITTSPFIHDVAHQAPVVNVPTCFGVPATNPTVCSGVGACIADNTCACGKLHTGSKCENFTCFGVPQGDPSVCDGNGDCVALDTCVCRTGKYGHNCKYPTCYGYTMEDPSVCNGNGFCTNTDACLCSFGWSGSQCQNPVCFNVTSDDARTCWGRGVCAGPDTCVCTPPYSGYACKSPQMTISVAATTVVNGQNVSISGSGLVQTTGAISCDFWTTDGTSFDTVEATVSSPTSVSCPVSIAAATNEVINVKLVRKGSPADDSDPSNTVKFTLINSALTTATCGNDIPGSTGCPNVTVTDQGTIVAASLQEGRKALTSSVKNNIQDMQGYVDFTIESLSGSHGSPIEFWFFDDTLYPSTYASLEVGNKLSLFYDTVGGGAYFDRVQERCNFQMNTKYRLVLKVYQPNIYMINATLYEMPLYTSVCTIEQVPRSFNPVAFFARNYSMVLSASDKSEQEAVSSATDASVSLAVDVMVLECQPGKCKVDKVPLMNIPAAEPFPWLSVVIPAVVMILIAIFFIVAVIIGVAVWLKHRKDVYINEEVEIYEDVEQDFEDFNIADETEESEGAFTKHLVPNHRK